ncbi:MAG: hypothetical protein ACFFBC_14580 [Promethearchaeota archaeon]
MISGVLPTSRYLYYDTREMFGYVSEFMDSEPPLPEMLKWNK